MNFRSRIGFLFGHHHVLSSMAFKQFKARYAGSVLGIFWAVLNPLLITLVVSFVFTAIFKVAIPRFPLFVLSGMFPWMFFSAALSEASSSILAQQNILRQFNVPRAILPLSSVLACFLNYLAGWLIIFPVFVFFQREVLGLFPWLLLAFLLTFVFVCGLGLLFSILSVFSRDFGNLLGVILMFWLWVTPVFYSVDMVPEAYRWVCDVNPMTPLVTFYRDVLFWARPPEAIVVAGASAWACASLLSGLAVFSWLEPQVLKRL